MLTVNELMTVLPTTVQIDTPIIDVRLLMSQESIRQLPVLDGRKLVGIVTERDMRSADLDPLPYGITVEAIMTPEPFVVTPTTPAYRAAEMLRIYKIGALPVVAGEELVGIVTVSDFLEQFMVTDEAIAV